MVNAWKMLRLCSSGDNYSVKVNHYSLQCTITLSVKKRSSLSLCSPLVLYLTLMYLLRYRNGHPKVLITLYVSLMVEKRSSESISVPFKRDIYLQQLPTPCYKPQ